MASVLHLLKVGLPVPAYTTLCRRRRKLEVDSPAHAGIDHFLNEFMPE